MRGGRRTIRRGCEGDRIGLSAIPNGAAGVLRHDLLGVDWSVHPSSSTSNDQPLEDQERRHIRCEACDEQRDNVDGEGRPDALSHKVREASTKKYPSNHLNI